MTGIRPAIILKLTLLVLALAGSAAAAVVAPPTEDQEKAVYDQALMQRTSMERAGAALQREQERQFAERDAQIMALRGDPDNRTVEDDPIPAGEPDPGISRPYGLADYTMAAGLAAMVAGLILMIVRSKKAYAEVARKKRELQAASARKKSDELAAVNAALDHRLGDKA